MAKKHLRLAAVVVAVFALAIGAYSYFGDRTTPTGQPPLVQVDVAAFEQFQRDFNAAQEQVRVIALLSPT
jgi:hypothetical protein